MQKASVDNKKVLKELQAQLIQLQGALAEAEKREGKDLYIDVKVKKNQARLQKFPEQDGAKKVVGKFYIEVAITAKQAAIFVPISVASGKKTAGFMYHIEGTAAASIVTTEINVSGESVSQVMLGTLRFAHIPAGKTALFQLHVVIRGQMSKRYKIVFTRLNYKLQLTDTRYQQYRKEIHSSNLTVS